MKSLTIRIPEQLDADLAAEGRRRGIGKSEVARERLALAGAKQAKPSAALAAVKRLAGTLTHLPPDLSTRVDEYLRKTGYGKTRHPR